MSRYAQILTTGRYIPERIITNDEMNEMLGENVGEWLVENVGIQQRHVMANDETTSDMIVAASRQALERANLQSMDLGRSLESIREREEFRGIREIRFRAGTK